MKEKGSEESIGRSAAREYGRNPETEFHVQPDRSRIASRGNVSYPETQAPGADTPLEIYDTHCSG